MTYEEEREEIIFEIRSSSVIRPVEVSDYDETLEKILRLEELESRNGHSVL